MIRGIEGANIFRDDKGPQHFLSSVSEINDKNLLWNESNIQKREQYVNKEKVIRQGN